MEQWKDIPETVYQISNFAEIRNSKTKKMIKPLVRPDGYVILSLRKVGEIKKSCFYLHRLMAETFIPNPLNLPQVDHIDNNKQNNCLENLQWITAEKNTIKSQGKKIKAISPDSEEFSFDSIGECSRKLGMEKKSIKWVLNGKFKTHKKWKFKKILES